MQDENLHKLLTVYESMLFSINMKIGSKMKSHDKKVKIKETLISLGLHDHMNTFVLSLSGGQKKRLAIAFEVVDDPGIMFLDEPTTGLDSMSATQCIQLLKMLAREGKTIVCTIHTPSAILFGIFDHLYVLASGNCIYQGSTKNLVPFLSESGLQCPESYNPSDFLMEIASGDYGFENKKLTEKIENGLNDRYRQLKTDHNGVDFSLPNNSKNKSSSSFFNQLRNLVIRNFLMLYRDKTIMWLRLAIHITVAVLVGLFFQNTGNQAAKMVSNFYFLCN